MGNKLILSRRSCSGQTSKQGIKVQYNYSPRDGDLVCNSALKEVGSRTASIQSQYLGGKQEKGLGK